MNILFDNHRDILKVLVKHGVDFMLVGGYAVIFYGYERTTGDLDIWLKPVVGNIAKTIEALKDFGIDEEDLDAVKQLDLSKAQVFFVGEEPSRVDFLTMINGVRFDEAFASAEKYQLGDVAIPIINYQHLIQSKQTGRAKDAADIEELERINRKR